MSNIQQQFEQTMQQPLQDYQHSYEQQPQQQLEEKQSSKLYSEEKKDDSTSIYVGNLPYNTLEDKLQALFEKYGTVYSVTLIKDKMTGRARGFGFVKMDIKQADIAIESLDGTEFGGRDLHVSKAKERNARPPRRDYRSGPRRDYRGRRSYRDSYGSDYGSYSSRGDDTYHNGNNYSGRSGGYRGKGRYESSSYRSGERYAPYERRYEQRERDFPSEYDERRGQE